jgi:putative flavoprotein involved in K+ transport
MDKNLSSPEHFDTVVIGGGQSGLSMGYHLKQRGEQFVILDGNARIGDVWRNRWDSLRLFTPTRFDGLDGMKAPGPRNGFIAKDDMADYLESYAREFDLPVRNGVRVDHLGREDGHFVLRSGGRCLTAENVVVAMGAYQSPKVPAFATQLDPSIRQLHSIEYRNPGQLQPGPVLIVGSGNSGAEIAKEVSTDHETWLAGRDVGQVPFTIDSRLGRMLVKPVLRGLFHRVLTVRTPMGRRMRPKVLTQGGPLIRVKRKELETLGVKCVPRVAGVQDGKPRLDDGRVVDAANVIWCTGFHPGFAWIDLDVMGEHEPNHKRGVVDSHPGLYFVGLEFLYAFSSEMVHGVGRDAAYIAKQIHERGDKAVKPNEAEVA